MYKLNVGEREELAEAEAVFPGFVRVESVTRFSVRLEVRGEKWEFIEEEGAFYLKSKMDPERVPGQLFRLAFLRAREEVHAMRTGHREAAEKKRARSGRTESKHVEREKSRVRQRLLPMELHTHVRPRKGRSSF